MEEVCVSTKNIDEIESTDVNIENGKALQNCTDDDKKQTVKRGKSTERTKRWAERKKALVEASGADLSESDSMASDVQLSPVQKARAKSNADIDKERSKRVERALKQLEIDANFGLKGDFDDHLDLLRKSSMSIGAGNGKGDEAKENYIPRSVRFVIEVSK